MILSLPADCVAEAFHPGQTARMSRQAANEEHHTELRVRSVTMYSPAAAPRGNVMGPPVARDRYVRFACRVEIDGRVDVHDRLTLLTTGRERFRPVHGALPD